MHVDVSDILASDEGTTAEFNIAGEQPELEDVTLASPVNGQLKFARTKTGLELAGRLQTSVELECHRCLRSFVHELDFPFTAEFSLEPADDQFPITSSGRVDLDEAARQEIVVHLPPKQLCAADCAGIKMKKSES
ncbi:MAG TPA: DUF177 domain-containing protein [Candidatus Dormibacteraeota bacterium]|nr:DUF177 domain-containing protein [Candidatus Dormibacteraeota bacterium]